MTITCTKCALYTWRSAFSTLWEILLSFQVSVWLINHLSFLSSIKYWTKFLERENEEEKKCFTKKDFVWYFFSGSWKFIHHSEYQQFTRASRDCKYSTYLQFVNKEVIMTHKEEDFSTILGVIKQINLKFSKEECAHKIIFWHFILYLFLSKKVHSFPLLLMSYVTFIDSHTFERVCVWENIKQWQSFHISLNWLWLLRIYINVCIVMTKRKRKVINKLQIDQKLSFFFVCVNYDIVILFRNKKNRFSRSFACLLISQLTRRYNVKNKIF